MWMNHTLVICAPLSRITTTKLNRVRRPQLPQKCVDRIVNLRVAFL
jgi:hypothetical protein